MRKQRVSLTVCANIGYGLHDLPRAASAARVQMVMEQLALTGLEGRYPSELSGGQQQRIALGRALAPDPGVLLLDEPLSALDAPLRRQLLGELRRVLRAWRKSAILVTHDLGEAYELADRVVVYERGRVLQAAPKAARLWYRLWQPASEAVARSWGCGTSCEAKSSRRLTSASRSLWHRAPGAASVRVWHLMSR